MSKAIFCKIALALFAIVLGAASAARADGVALVGFTSQTSSSDIAYDYGLSTTCSNSGANAGRCSELVFDFGQTVTISGLSGVTGASVGGVLASAFTVESFTPTSVTFQMDETGCTGAQAGRPCEITVTGNSTGDFIVDSTVDTLGMVDWSAQTENQGALSGTVEGPVGSVPAPEPSSLGLMLLRDWPRVCAAETRNWRPFAGKLIDRIAHPSSSPQWLWPRCGASL